MHKSHLSLIVGLLVTGCMKPLPPEPLPVIVIEVRRLPSTTTHGQIIDAEVIEPPVKTWLSKEEAEQLRKEQNDPCYKGDPLCDVIP